MGEAVHPLRQWREAQTPSMTLDAAAAEVGTVRQVWFDWERGRRIPNRAFMAKVHKLTRGAVTPNDFYDLPPIGQLELGLGDLAPAPLFDGAAASEANCAVAGAGGGADAPQLQVAA